MIRKSILCFLFSLTFIFNGKSVEGSENSLSHYLISVVSQADLNVDEIRLAKSFPGRFDCYYDLYAFSQSLKPDPSDSSQNPLTLRKKPRGIITKSPDCNILQPSEDLFTCPSSKYKSFQPFDLLFIPKYVGYKQNIRPPPYKTVKG